MKNVHKTYRNKKTKKCRFGKKYSKSNNFEHIFANYKSFNPKKIIFEAVVVSLFCFL